MADYVSRRNIAKGEAPLTVKDVLVGMTTAHEIQGVLALENSFNRVGLDHVLLVWIATCVVFTQMLGGSKEEVTNAVPVFFADGSKTENVSVDHPIGHRHRRGEGIPELKKKFAHNLALRIGPKNAPKISAIVAELATTETTRVQDFTDLFVV